MEIKEQDIFANATDSEEVLNPEPSLTSVPEVQKTEASSPSSPSVPVAESVPEASSPSSPSAPVAESVPEASSPSGEGESHSPSIPMNDEEPFELKAEEPKARRKPTPKPAPKPTEPKAEEPTPAASSPQAEPSSVQQPSSAQKPKPEPTSAASSPLGKGESHSPSQPSQPSQSSPSPTPTPKKPRLDSLTWQLFATFFKIGFVTFGGGYAMIPMIESEVVDKKKWVEREQFLDLIAIAQTCPGVFAINISTFIGYKLKHNFGACMAALGAALPSFLIILLIATMFTQVQDIPWVAACFRGIRPAVVALIAVPTFNLAKSAKINLNTCWIPIGSALLIWALKVNPVFIIIAAALGGYLYGTYLKAK